MTMPFYVSPEQIIKDKADYARKGIARGRSVVVVQYVDGLLFVAENPSRALHKVSEIYDRIAFAAVGKYNEFENLRVAGIRLADLRGYSFDRRDVTGRGLANAYAQTLGNIFTETTKPYEVEIVVAEVGDTAEDDQMYRLTFDGSVADEHGAVVMGGSAETIGTWLDEHYREGMTARRRAADGGGGSRPRRRPGRGDARRAGSRSRVMDRTRPAPPQVPPDQRRSPGVPARRQRRELGVGLWPWTAGSSGSRPSTASPARSGASVASRPDEVARYLFRRVVSWGRSSNVFLRNGARLYLDVGSHPEYATPECDAIRELVDPRQGGGADPRGLLVDAERRLHEEGIAGDVYLFKNNTDSAGNSYGCHENYLVGRQGEFSRIADVLIPFLVSRQLVAGAGKVLQTPRGAVFCLSQRAEHIWEGVSSATTRSRPIINTRDEPHADAERFRRLHVIVGDSSMAEATTLLKVGSTELCCA